jgi:hypothetical protein
VADTAEAVAPAESVPTRTSRAWRIALPAWAAFWILARALGYRLGWNTVVRCRRGHLFTTIWIPGVKLKALDLGVARVQRCPVGRHWTLVTPVRESTLTNRARRRARAHRDVRIP